MDSVLGRYHLTVAIVFIWRVLGVSIKFWRGGGNKGEVNEVLSLFFFRSRVAPPFSIYTERDKQQKKSNSK